MKEIIKNLLNDKRDFETYCKENGFMPVNPKLAFRKFQDLKDKERLQDRFTKLPSSKQICESYLRSLKHWGTYNSKEFVVCYDFECGSEVLKLENVKLK